MRNIITNNQIKKQIAYNPAEIHCSGNKNAIVLLSGGLDSSVALWWALYNYDNVRAITVDYNQPHFMENDYAEQLCDLVGIKLDTIKLDIPKDYWALTHRITRGQAGLMIAIAALNIGHEGADIVNGILKTDDLYGDCHREHLDNVSRVLPHPKDFGSIGIATPLRAFKDKLDVSGWGYMAGVPMQNTWSCRNPINNEPCNNCSQCFERNLVFNSFYDEFGVDSKEISEWQMVLGSPYHPVVKEPKHEILVSIKAFIEMGGMTKTETGWKYDAPDGTKRIASRIKNPKVIPNVSINKGCLCEIVSINGILDDGRIWEICFSDESTIAVSDALPSIEIINNAFNKKFIENIS